MSRTFFKKFSTMIRIPHSYYSSATGMPLQASVSVSKPLLQQYLILKWTTRAWHAVIASLCVSCALETHTQFLHRIFTIISTIPSQIYLVRYLLGSNLISSILPKCQDPIFPKGCEDYVKALEYSARSDIVIIVRWIREYRESQLIAGYRSVSKKSLP